MRTKIYHKLVPEDGQENFLATGSSNPSCSVFPASHNPDRLIGHKALVTMEYGLRGSSCFVYTVLH